MTTLTVVNIKCGGCSKTITKQLEKLQCTDISISSDTQKIAYSLENDTEEKHQEIITKLEDLGYPLKGSEKAKSFLKKAQSYASCAVGKFL